MGLAEVPQEQLVFLALALLGTYHIVRACIQLVKAIWIVFLRPGKDLSGYGSWALVTGATDGIGKAFCYRLAEKGMNLVLVGRTESKLQELAKELHWKDRKISVKYVALDFSSDKLEAGLQSIAKTVEDLDVGILINNVGTSYSYARFFHEVDQELLQNLLRVNILAMTRMSQLLIPGMLKRRKGAIVNIGSGSGSILPSDPLYSIYAASKSYVQVLSRSMYVEYKSSGIDVQCQVPLYVKTKLAKIRNTSLTVPSPDLYAKSALRSIGYEPLSTPYWAHYLLWWLIAVVPERIVDFIRLRNNLDIRRRGQAKEAKTKDN